MQKSIERIFLLLLVICFVSCTTKVELNEYFQEPINQKSLINYFEIVPYDNGFYYLDDDITLHYYNLDGSSDVSLGTLDEQTKEYSNLYCGTTIHLYDQKIVYISSYFNDEGNQYQNLIVQDLDGSNRTTLLSFQYTVTQFVINDNYVITTESKEDGTSEIHIHSFDGKEKTSYSENSNIGGLIADGKNIFYSLYENEKYILKKLNLDDFTIDINDIRNNVFVYEDDDKISTYQIHEDQSITSYIYLLDHLDTSIIEIENEIINYFDEEYIYTSTTSSSNMIYHIYDWNGQMYKEIIPANQILNEDCSVTNMFWEADATQIIRIVSGNVIGNTTIQGKDQFFKCDIENGTCSFLK